MEPDFTGYATRSGLKCLDGRVIMSHAFKGNDGQTVPLVWMHQHDSPDNILGYAILHSLEEGVKAEGFFNDTPQGKNAKALVKHGDVKALSIYANQLVQQAMNVVHGVIREVSIVLSGANPGAFIDNVNLAHGDGVTVFEDEAIIYSGEEIVLVKPGPVPGVPAVAPKPALAALAAVSHATDLGAALPSAGAVSSPTVGDILSTFTEQQREVLYALIGAAMQQSAPPGTQITLPDTDDPKGGQVSRNVFDQTSGDQPRSGAVLTHSDMAAIFDAARRGGSLKNAVEEFALEHGITSIDVMFPDARAATDTPDYAARRTEWVAGVLAGTHHTPFARIKTLLADITLDEARARGYVKGAMKREEWFAVSRRITTPQTVYKKQKLDRDDIVDITDFDVVAWLKQEMRLMLDEEVARAILIGDGRDVADPDKILETNVRPVSTDSDVYVTYVNVATADLPPNASKTYEAIVDTIATGMQFFLGSGMPVMYAPRSWITKMLLTKDTLGRRLHNTLTELADAMGIAAIVPVDAMEPGAPSLVGVILNLADYTVGTDRGGEVNFFDDFDIDYNKYIYLYETRLSGALTKFKSALVVKIFTGTMLADPTVPTFVKATGVVTIPTMTNVTYVSVNDTTGVESAALTAGAQGAIAAGTSIHIRAKANATYTFASNGVCNWTFQRPAA